MKRTTYKVPKFYLDTNKDSNTAAIFLKYSFAPGQRISYFTGCRIEPNKWNPETQRVKRNAAGASDINDILNKIAETATEAERKSRLSKTPLTKEALKQILDRAFGKRKSKSQFFEAFNEFVNTESSFKSWALGTLKKFNTLKTHLEAFEKEQQIKQSGYNLNFAQLNDEQLHKDLITFWQKEYNLRNSSILVYFKFLRWFYKWCIKKGHASWSATRPKISLKEANNRLIFLDMAEIRLIAGLEIPNNKEYLKKTKDILIFQCMTGIRFSDLHNLKISDIDFTTNKIRINAIKTNTSLEINLNKTALKILGKYKSHQAATGKVLPVPANQVYNRFLKELAQIARLTNKITLVHFKGGQRIEEIFEKWQLITTHTARRSFITNSLAEGTSSETIRSWTGHQSDESFNVYYEVVETRKSTDIEKIAIDT